MSPKEFRRNAPSYIPPVPGNEAGKIHDREILANGQPVYARNKVYYHHEGTVYGADKRADGSPRLYSLSPHEDEDVYAIAKKPGRSEGTAVDPDIDPVAIFADGVSGGSLAALRTTGTPLRRAGIGFAHGAGEASFTALDQYARPTITGWFK